MTLHLILLLAIFHNKDGITGIFVIVYAWITIDLYKKVMFSYIRIQNVSSTK